MKRLPVFALSVLLCCATACIYPYSANLSGESRALVVEGNILAGGTTTITLSYPRNMRNSWDWRGSGGGDPGEFFVWLEVEGSGVWDGDGREKTDIHGMVLARCFDIDTRALSSGDRCRLHISRQRNEEQYQSEWLEVLQGPVLDSLSFYKNYDDGQLELRASFHGEGENDCFLITSDELWEFHAWYPAHLVYDSVRDTILYEKTPAYYYCWDYLDAETTVEPVDASATLTPKMINFIYRSIPRQESRNRLQEVYRSVVTVSSLSRDNYEYWRNLDQISYAGGDLFTPNPSERRGNIRDVNDPYALVIGYVSASTFDTDTLYYLNEKEHFYRPVAGSGNYTDYLHYFYRSDWPSLSPSQWVIYGPSEDDPDFWAWIERRCTDCTMDPVGSKNRPADWPNDHY